MIDVEAVIARANILYGEVRGYSMGSEQIRALAKALVEAINAEFDRRDVAEDKLAEFKHRAG